MKTYDKVYNSEKDRRLKDYQLATGYISSTTVFFEREGIVASIEAKGEVAFSDCEERQLAAVTLPAVTDGKGVYTMVLCAETDGAIILKFPRVRWIDNYPHCDGESDRWDTETVGYRTVTFDSQTNEAVVTEE